MADSAMVSAYFFAQKIEDFHPRFLSETFFTVPFLCKFFKEQIGYHSDLRLLQDHIRVTSQDHDIQPLCHHFL